MTVKFKDVLELVHRAARIEYCGVLEGDRWSVFEGMLQVGGAQITLRLLHLPAGTSRREEILKGITALRQGLTPGMSCQIIYADSLVEEKRFPRIEEEFARPDMPVLSESRFFASFAEQQSQAYIQRLRNVDLSDFIDPSIERLEPSGQWKEAKYQQLIELVRVRHNRPSIHVFLADPGQGKTHFSRYAASVALDAKRIPLLVSSFQWEHVDATVLTSPWTTILNTFRHYRAPISWAEGAEQTFVQVAQGSGLFQLIFDGLDEFVLRSPADISVRDTLAQFFELAVATESPILVTARTEFWEGEAAATFRELAAAKAINAMVYRQKPFSKADAQQYFMQRHLATEVSGTHHSRRSTTQAAAGAEETELPEIVQQATELFARLQEAVRVGTDEARSGIDLVGRGFFLYNIWALVDGPGAAKAPVAFAAVKNPLDADALNWVVENLCDREDRRLSLRLPTSKQIRLFELLAELFSENNAHATTENVAVVAEAYLELKPDHVKQLVGDDADRPGKLSRHPLIHKRKDKHWEFVQTQLLYFFLANRVLAIEKSADAKKLGQLLGRLNDAKYLIFELASSLLERMLSKGFGARMIADICRKLVDAERSDMRGRESRKSGIGGCLAVISTKHFVAGSAQKRERTELLTSMVSSSETIESLWLVDSLVGFDFRGTHFKHCQFDNVQFLNCVFDQATRFESCRFVGTTVTRSPGLESAHFDERCVLDPRLREMQALRAERRVVAEYGEDELRADLVAVLETIASRIEPHHAAFPEGCLKAGSLGTSPFCDRIAAAIVRHLTEGTGVEVGPKRAHRLTTDGTSALSFFISNGVFGPPIDLVWKDLVAALGAR